MEVFGTISKTRNLSGIGECSEIPYSMLLRWESKLKDKIEEKEYHILFILEFYRRYNKVEAQKIAKKGYRNAGKEIRGMIFPASIYDAWKVSTVKWKKKLILEFSGMNMELLTKQKCYIEHAIKLEYDISPPSLKIKSLKIETL